MCGLRRVVGWHGFVASAFEDTVGGAIFKTLARVSWSLYTFSYFSIYVIRAQKCGFIYTWLWHDMLWLARSAKGLGVGELLIACGSIRRCDKKRRKILKSARRNRCWTVRCKRLSGGNEIVGVKYKEHKYEIKTTAVVIMTTIKTNTIKLKKKLLLRSNHIS